MGTKLESCDTNLIKISSLQDRKWGPGWKASEDKLVCSGHCCGGVRESDEPTFLKRGLVWIDTIRSEFSIICVDRCPFKFLEYLTHFSNL